MRMVSVIFIIFFVCMFACVGAVVWAVLKYDYKKAKRGKACPKRLYLCDPEKHINCRKTTCQEDCFDTTNPKYAVLDTEGNPIVTYDAEKERRFHEGEL